MTVALPLGAQSARYNSLTDTKRSFTNLNPEVVRGFHVEGTEGNFHCYAINSYESTVTHHTSLGGAPAERWRTVTNPVSIVEHAGGLYVVGQGNYALARHSKATGDIEDLILLRAEPADIAIDTDNDWAWVSCMGDDSVVQIDLNTGTSTGMEVIKIWREDPVSQPSFRLKRPRFLYLDYRTADPADNALYVAPYVSGNNTLQVDEEEGPGIIKGGDLPVNSQGYSGLPDEDLFRITTNPDTVTPMVRGAGSLILAHGVNPVGGKYWMLNVNHFNAPDPATQPVLSEPALRGVFASNDLTIVDSFGGTLPVTPSTIIDLDDVTPSGGTSPTYDPNRSVSFPYALEFFGDGLAAVAGSTSPVVAILNTTGTRIAELQLDDAANEYRGRVARTVRFHEGSLFVYCQQTSNILRFALPNTTPASELSLGNDPTPAAVAAGRDTWYDARPSTDGRTSCNTCHPAGQADGLAWQLSDLPVDHKDRMVTQTLVGIEDTFPYHWRGERDLEDFNGAFPGLLGHAEKLPEGPELDAFLEFVFSLTAHANPQQMGVPAIDPVSKQLVLDFDRLIKDSLVPGDVARGFKAGGQVVTAFGSATAGDLVYRTIPSLGSRSCNDCHQLPTGSNGDFFSMDAAQAIAQAGNLKVAHLDTQLPLKNQPLVDVLMDTSGLTSQRPLLGFGASHKGDRVNLFHFNRRFQPPLADQQVADLTAFVHIFDHGIAPSVHYAARLANGVGSKSEIKDTLVYQADLGWVGIAVVGVFPHPTTQVMTKMNWYYDRGLGKFVADDPSWPSKKLAAFNNFGTYPALDNVFLGVPPGNERRLGIDQDNDELSSYEELLTYSTDPWDPDSDGDGWPDGYEIEHSSDPNDENSGPVDTTPPLLIGVTFEKSFINASQVKFHFETDEACTWEIQMSGKHGGTLVENRETLDTIHTAVVHKLLPSTTFEALPQSGTDVVTEYTDAVLVLTDLSGNSSLPIDIDQLEELKTSSMIHDGTDQLTVVDSIVAVDQQRIGSRYEATLDIRVGFREFQVLGQPVRPADNHAVIGQILKQAPNGQDWVRVDELEFDTTPCLPHSFTLVDYCYDDLEGPFVILPPTDANGMTQVTFGVDNLTQNPDQKVMFNVLAVERVPTGTNLPDPECWGGCGPIIPGLGTYDPDNPFLRGRNGSRTLQRYMFPDVLPENRNFISTE